MSNKVKISELPLASTTFSDTETGVVVQEGVTKKYELSRLAFTGELKVNDTGVNGGVEGGLLGVTSSKLVNAPITFVQTDGMYFGDAGLNGGKFYFWNTSSEKYSDIILDDFGFNFNTAIYATYFAGIGTGLTELDSSALSTGTVPSARLPIASAGTLGGIRISSDLAIDGSGITTVTPAARSNLGYGAATTVGTTGVVELNLQTSTRFLMPPLTGNVTLSLANDADGASWTLFIRGGTGGFTITWPSGFKWTGGSAPTLPSTTGQVLAVGVIRLASGEYWATAASNAG